ncbi:MAG: low-complexity tail membrane protein, partial [Synechococcaceae bacterium WB9_2_170]|nr:low-complexity tail membrane protein [Synechococcaceae bacterium WB9_2_170]
MTPRSEPLLWLQLIGLAAMPLELLLVLLLLAGSDPGPFPALERVLIWGMGAVGPAVLLWRQPPDPLSLLLLCTPQRQRSPDQLALTSEPVSLALKLLLASGAALLLPALWWLDTSSVLAHSFALLPGSSRLVSLLAVVPVLALLVWQWQQLVQATNLLIASGDGPATTTGGALEPRLCLGLPWLRLPGLDLPQPAKPEAAIPAALAAPEGPAPASPEPLESAEPAATTEVVVATEVVEATEVDVAAEVVETAERETVLETLDEETSGDENREDEPNDGESSDQASVDQASTHDSD